MRPLRIFVSHSFTDEHHAGGVSAFRSGLAQAVSEVQRRLPGGVRLDVVFASDRYGESLFAEILAEVKGADVAIVDLNGMCPNVLIEAGVRLGSGPAPIVIGDPSRWDRASLPSELSHLLVGLYDGAALGLRNLLAEPLRERVNEALDRLRRGAVRDVWFGELRGDLHVVCAPEPDRSRFASRENPNYLFVDNLDDRDALFEVAALTSRLYPGNTLARHASTVVTPDVLRRNLVVIGGPGFAEDEGNRIARELAQIRNLSVRYGDDGGEHMEFQGRRHLPWLRESGQVERDLGYFARFQNPLNSEATIVMAQGIYTAGTLGACLAFSDGPDAAANHAWLRERINVTAAADFEVLLQVSVGPGGVVTPGSVNLLSTAVLSRG